MTTEPHRWPDHPDLTPSQAWRELLTIPDGTVLDDDRPASLVSIVQRSADQHFVDEGLELLSDPRPVRRQRAARVLGQFGFLEGRPFGDRIAPALAAAARREADAATRAELVDALGSAEDWRWVPELLHHASDPHPGVRVAVAASLPLMFAGAPPDDDTIRTLIVLTSDADPDVRDWATMSLGVQTDLDTPEIREALAARLTDEGDTAFEACVGLARRGDVRALGRVERRLVDPESPVSLLDLEAAVALADPALTPLLTRLTGEWSGDEDGHTELLRLALARSTPDAATTAADLESATMALVERRLAGSGWRIELVGTYPHTRTRFTGPAGEEVTDEIWDGLAPNGFDPQRQADQWVYQVRAGADDSARSGTPPRE
ncbi:MAG: HEAT repeat domain-containing protein [Gordonia polyisoprenivorans]|nr:HEAT repeat domain-containing protein [Gordonia polyisoprenivorans]